MGHARIKSVDDIAPHSKGGGDIRWLLTPGTVGSTSGFMAVATLPPGEKIGEHYHPYSEEFVYLVRGDLVVGLDGKRNELRAGQGLFVPIDLRHRFLNEGSEDAFMVFHLCPLAPRPELGHVDTE
jgi:putative monooxygenase